MIDLNGDGIDDRLQLSDLSWFAQQALRARALLVPKAKPEAGHEYNAPAFYDYACARVRDASGKALAAPENPVNKDPDGYDYRSVPLLSWAPLAYPEETLPCDIAALAAVAVSEAPDIAKYPQYALAILEAVSNAADRARISLDQRVTMRGVKLAKGRHAPNAGHFARQRGRWCASLQWPTGRHVEAARLVSNRRARGLSPIFGHGAERWVDLRVMDKGTQAGRPLAYDAAGIVSRWGADGWEVAPPTVVAGEVVIDPYVLALFRRSSKPDVARGMRVVADGRKRWGISGSR
jgi:hypothetical protein